MKRFVPWVVRFSAFLLLTVLIVVLHLMDLPIPYRCFMGGCLLLLAATEVYQLREYLSSQNNPTKGGKNL